MNDDKKQSTSSDIHIKIFYIILLFIVLYFIYVTFFTSDVNITEMIDNTHGGEAPF